MKVVRILNASLNGCSFGIKASYFKNASLRTLTGGGGHFPCTGVIEFIEDDGRDDTESTLS